MTQNRIAQTMTRLVVEMKMLFQDMIGRRFHVMSGMLGECTLRGTSAQTTGYIYGESLDLAVASFDHYILTSSS